MNDRTLNELEVSCFHFQPKSNDAEHSQACQGRMNPCDFPALAQVTPASAPDERRSFVDTLETAVSFPIENDADDDLRSESDRCHERFSLVLVDTALPYPYCKCPG